MTTRTAAVYRMVMEDHVCPYGIKTVDLVKRQGFEVDDHHLTSREETDAFKDKYDVETTPQTFIEGKRIGGYDDVREFFGKSRSQPEEGETSYQPVIAIFAVALLLALGLSWAFFDDLFTVRAAEWFVSLSMTLLAVQKLQDVRSFSTMFLNYDLLAPLGAVRVRLSLRRGVGWHPDDRGRADLDRGAGCALHRYRRRSLGLQGRLH